MQLLTSGVLAVCFFVLFFACHGFYAVLACVFSNAVFVFFRAAFFVRVLWLAKCRFAKGGLLASERPPFTLQYATFLQSKRIPFTMLFVTYCMSVCYLFVRECCAHGCLCPALGLCVCAVRPACSMQMLSCVEACRDVAGAAVMGRCVVLGRRGL